MAKGLSAAKAKKILTDGYIKGKPLTAKQRKYFGAIASGTTPLKAINGGWLDKYQDGGSVPKAQTGVSTPIELDEVILKSVRKSPEWKAYRDSLNYYNKGEKFIKEGRAYDYLRERYKDPLKKDKYEKARNQKLEDEITEYGKRDYDYYKKGSAKRNVIQRDEHYGEGYEDGLHLFQDVYSAEDWSEPVVPLSDKIQPIEVLWGPESGPRPIYKKPTKPMDSYSSQLDSDGIEPYTQDLESLISGNIEAQPITQHKPYNQSDKKVSLGLLQKMGIENPESQGFHYIKDNNGNFKTMQTREAYRKGNLRPNNTPYPPKAQNGIKEAINKYLGDPQGEAREFAENPDELANIDNMRHAQATRLTQEAIANKTGNIPLVSDALGLLGSNALGIGHELTTLFGDKDKRDWLTKLQESGEDVFNNIFGSVVGALPMDNKTKDDVIKYASYNNMLPDGYVRGEQGEEDGLSENVYFKNEDNEVRRPEYKSGGWLDKYEDEELLKAQNGIPKFKLSDQKLNIDERATNLQIQDAVSKPETLRVIPELSEENYSVTGKQPIVRQSNDMVSAYEKPDMYDKFTDILASPLTSLGYLSSGQDIPDALPLGMENRSPHDALLDMFNPFAWAKYAASAKRNADQGEYLDAGFDALGAIPIVPAFLGYGKYAKNIKQIPKNKALFKQYEATGKKLNSEITKLKNLENNYNIRQGELLAKYKAKKITAEDYSKQVKSIQPWDSFKNPIPALQKQLRELNVKKEILNTPQKNILKNEKQLGKNISDGGTNNKGVFELNDNYVARLSAHGYDDASRLVNYSNKLSSPRIMKTHQVKEINGKVYQVQDKATGVPYTQLSEKQLKALPKNHIDDFHKDIIELEKNGLSIDISGGKSNIFYDPKKGFQFIDLGIGEMPNINDIKKVVKFKNGGLLNKYQMGGSLPGASGMMYSRTSGNASMEPGKLKKAQTGDTYDWEKIRENSPSFLENFTEPTIKPIEEKPKSFYDSLLNDAVISSGGTTEDWEKLSGMISYHESKNDPLAKQKVKKTKDNPTGIGLGRGLYQFEPDSFKTAANRAYNYSKKTGLDLPQFIKDIRSKKIKEASELTPDQQKTLLLADYRDKPTAKLKAFFSGDKDDQAIEDFWVTGHWSGGNKDEQERRTSFKKDASTYNNLYSKKKNGGWLDKYEDGGDVPKAQNGNFGGVNTDVQTTSGESATSEEPAYELVFPDDSNYDARYKETYEGGAFATYPNQLDEVVLNSGVDYEKYPLYDDLSEQDRQYFKDDGAIGRGVRRRAQTKRGLAEDALAIPGQLLQGALETAQAPQAAMVEGIEALRGNDYNFSNALPGSGMQRLPSQAFGFEDKPGWDLGGSVNTAMDIVADPTNLFGVGLYDDVVKLGLKAAPKLNSIAKTFGKYSDDLIDKTKNISKFNTAKTTPVDINAPWWETAGFNKPDIEMNNIFSRILDKLPKKVRETYASRVKGITKASDLPRLDPSEFDILKNIDDIMTLREMGGSRKIMLERALKSNLDDPILESIFYKSKKELQSELDDIISTIPKPKKVVGTLDPTEEGVEQAIENVNRYGVVQLNPDISGFSLNRPSTSSRSSVDIDTTVRNIYDDVDNVDNLVTGNVATKNSQINQAVTEIPNRVRQSKPAPKNSDIDVEGLSGQDLANISSYPYVKPGGFTEELVPLVKLGPNTSKRDYANMVKDARARVRMSTRGDIFTGSTDTSYQSYLPQLNEVFSSKMKGVADPIFLGYKPMNPMGNINRAAGSNSRTVTRGINENIAAYLNNQIDTNISKIKLPDDLLRPFFQNSSGEVMLPQYGLRKLKKGGVIKDDMGQWAHPGEVTEISGNTMATHGYGDNPLYVVPDVGEPRMVQANTGTQTFPGATKFTEYPMAKNGSSLVELNQLTNFTNYNTPQPGGWLDKYN